MHGSSKSRRLPLVGVIPPALESQLLPPWCMIGADNIITRNVADITMNKFMAQVNRVIECKWKRIKLICCAAFPEIPCHHSESVATHQQGFVLQHNIF